MCGGGGVFWGGCGAVECGGGGGCCWVGVGVVVVAVVVASAVVVVVVVLGVLVGLLVLVVLVGLRLGDFPMWVCGRGTRLTRGSDRGDGLWLEVARSGEALAFG